ncbi:MAG: substrate-binding domain-containing protein [Leptolyngbyaceae cyanobacterium bins.59]|nr:substrate-binding domain-containing protein [Leptolyngbyaceae cyanobacterium bins.59]
MKPQHRSLITSIALTLASLGLAFAPIPGTQQTIIVVAGTELQEPLQVLEAKFEQEYPNLRVELKFQGSQDLVNRYIDNKNDFNPTILIPAGAGFIEELGDRWRTQHNSDPFYETPRPIAKTLLVAIAWPERGKILFPDGQFRWERVERAMQAGNWSDIQGPANWGSFDFVTTDPTRSNSGQLTLSLWSQAKLGGNSLKGNQLSDPAIPPLFKLVKRSVYQPPRSTDVLLQEFIARGPNDADLATVYESIALYRWQQAGASQGQPYQIYYLNPTIETVSTAAIVRQNVDPRMAKAANQFLDFLTQPAQQTVFVQHGFRPVSNSVDLKTAPQSPWNQQVPGAKTDPAVQITQSPDRNTLTEIIRVWERAQ